MKKEQSAELVKQLPDFVNLDEIKRSYSRDEREELSVTHPLPPDVRTAIFPVFNSERLHRATATLTETGESQQWEGVSGQQADAWVVRGYSEVEVLIEFQTDGGWKHCQLKIVEHGRIPNPNRWTEIQGVDTDAPGAVAARVNLVYDRTPPQ